ncbi:SelT/SelW/SelH family protein [Flavihumibacter profundi]|jgi:selenoprotein W-related protein|uniref:SelT/SelW/SelH family protein n=1 Tax=Flavihumibacter profundi TaxID=2716883 RepID=UPI001CC3573F|nr:SelT/SelW/SelH family protein [Flavihumibacter profundi]MBZ5857370.1 SelT/SelW/SelH family protein [Flavihumibacter profundi]
MKPNITIEYCPKCHWLLRAAYMAQELLTTFESDLKSVALEPSAESGKYAISINGRVIFDRKANGGFEDIKVIKQLVRDVVNPQKSLGHSDRQ